MRPSWLLEFPQFQIAFVALAVGCWFAVATVADGEVVKLAVLVGIGVVLPNAVFLWCPRSE